MGKKVIAVVGATGVQGGGLARALLADARGEYAVRALTRKPDSDKARALAALGAEVRAADLDDGASLRKAFDGAHGVFCVTNFWEHFSPEREIAQARAMARACKDARVAHAVWSTLEDTRRRVPLSDGRMPTLQGKYKVPHFDGKGEGDAAFEESGVPTTYLLTSFYWDNLVHFGMGPRKGAAGRLTLALPLGESRLPGIAAEDIGKCARGVFAAGTRYLGKRVGIAGEHLTGKQMAAALAKALGTPVDYADVPLDAYRALGFPGADDLGNMFQYQRDFEAEFCGARDPRVARSLNPELQTFAQWLSHVTVPVA